MPHAAQTIVIRHAARCALGVMRREGAYPKTAMRRAAATRPKKAPMKQSSRSLVDIARFARPNPRMFLRDLTGRERWHFGKGVEPKAPARAARQPQFLYVLVRSDLRAPKRAISFMRQCGSGLRCGTDNSISSAAK